MKRNLVLLALLAACKQRGTIAVPSVLPCEGAQPEGVAVYLQLNGSCTPDCGLHAGFSCERPGCIAACEATGYCTLAELDELELVPPQAGHYALVFSYRYAGALADEGFVCFDVEVQADGTSSMSIAPGEEIQQCCMAGT